MATDYTHFGDLCIAILTLNGFCNVKFRNLELSRSLANNFDETPTSLYAIHVEWAINCHIPFVRAVASIKIDNK